MSNIGKALHQRRKAKKMTRDQLAKGVCDINTLQKIELYGTMPRFDTIANLAAKLNCSLDDLWHEGNFENYSEYSSLRKEITYYNKKHDYVHVERLINSISLEFYESLPQSEQQYIQYNRAAVVLKVHNDIELACTIAEDALELTIVPAGDIFTETEMLLINLITSIRFDEYSIFLLNKVYSYCLLNRIEISDKTYMTIANGMLQCCFRANEWSKLLDAAIDTEEDGFDNDNLMYATNVWFSKGIALYMLNSKEKGREYITKALELCLLLEQMRNYNYFMQHLVNLGIKIKTSEI